MFNRYLINFVILLTLLVLSGCSTTHRLQRDNLNKQRAQYAPIKNGYLEYYRFGKGSPIILIAGYMSDISNWDREFLAVLAQQHQVIVFNNRNVGRSIVHSSHYASKDYANDVYQLIQTLKLKKPAIIGISMGGMIAQQLAVLHADKLGQLILINTAISGKQAVPPCPFVANGVLNMPKNIIGRFLLAIDFFFPPRWKLPMAYAIATDRFLPQDYKEIDPCIKPQQEYLLMRWATDEVTAEKLSELDLPVLILNGESDIVIPPINSIILARTIPDSQLVRWKEGGHGMIFQCPHKIATIINNFIETASPP